MNISPVIFRELRAESRHPATYWMRVSAAAVAFIIFVLVARSGLPGFGNGAAFFSQLHTVVFFAIWILVPPLTADCIARERREGTLGLLFLTPLRARQIVLGKSFVHMLRATSIVIAVAPILTVPLLIGGVTWTDIITSSTFNACALLLCLAAGILASSFGKRWGRTLLLAEVITLLLGYLFLFLAAFWLNMYFSGAWLGRTFSLEDVSFFTGLRFSWGRLIDYLSNSRRMSNPGLWPIFLCSLFISSVMIFMFAVLFAGFGVKKSWQDLPPSRLQKWLTDFFCTPQYWKGLLRRKMDRALDRNPISWLQQHSWSARLTKWGWCLVAISLVTFTLSASVSGSYRRWPGGFFDMLLLVATGTLIAMSFSAANSFREDRQSGVLELLLVTPLTEANIVFGRIRGILLQFLPSMTIILLAWGFALMERSTFGRSRDPGDLLWAFLSSYITLPFIGLFLSMQIRNYLIATTLIFVVGVLIPYLVGVFFAHIFVSYESGDAEFTAISIIMAITQVCFAAIARSLLLTRLKSRRFVVAPA